MSKLLPQRRIWFCLIGIRSSTRIEGGCPASNVEIRSLSPLDPVPGPAFRRCRIIVGRSRHGKSRDCLAVNSRKHPIGTVAADHFGTAIVFSCPIPYLRAERKLFESGALAMA